MRGFVGHHKCPKYYYVLRYIYAFILFSYSLFCSKKREVVPDLAPMLWHSFGTIAALLQEIINVYPTINPATLTAHQSNRVCNALALLQCVASHQETRYNMGKLSKKKRKFRLMIKLNSMHFSLSKDVCL